MPLSAGDKLGPYEILSPPGKGGIGEVWRAQSTPESRSRHQDLRPAVHRPGGAPKLLGRATIQTAMTLEQLRSTSRDQIIRLAAECGAANVRVFGSVARGDTDSRSDVDLLVDLEPGRSLLDLARLQRKLEALLTIPVDVVSSRGLRDRVRETVLRDAQPL